MGSESPCSPARDIRIEVNEVFFHARIGAAEGEDPTRITIIRVTKTASCSCPVLDSSSGDPKPVTFPRQPTRPRTVAFHNQSGRSADSLNSWSAQMENPTIIMMSKVG